MAGKEGSTDHHAMPVSLVIALFGGAVMFILWWANHRELTAVWLWFEWLLLQPVRYTVGMVSDYSVALSGDIQRALNEVVSCPKEVADPNAVNKGTRIQCYEFDSNWSLGWWVSSEVGKYWRWPLLLAIGYTGYRVFKNPLKKFRGNMTVPMFLEMQSKTWKAIVPFVKRDLYKESGEDMLPSRSGRALAIKEKVVVNGVFLPSEAKRVLKAQLGNKMTPETMTDVEKALFVIFGLRVIRKKKDAAFLLDSINESMRGGRPANLYPAVKRFQEIYENKLVKEKIASHQYTATVLFELLVRACDSDGVLAPSEFLAWVKPAQRSLWYALNRAPADERRDIASFSEGVQIVCQWQAEKVAKDNNLEMTDVFYDRAILSWKESLYKTGLVNEEVSNINAVALRTKKEEGQRAAKKKQSRFQ